MSEEPRLYGIADSDARIPVGSGLPHWLPTELYLSADETRALDPIRYGGYGMCGICGNPPSAPTFQLEGAHIWRGGMSGKKNAGPTVEVCHPCHQGRYGVDRVGDATLAIRRSDLQPVYLVWDGDRVHERGMRWPGWR